MTIVLQALLAYLINLASNERTAAIADRRKQDLLQVLKQEKNLQQGISSTRSFREELRCACNDLVRTRESLEITDKELAIWSLLSDDVFQNDLAEWLMAGGIEEGRDAKKRLYNDLERAIANAGADSEALAFLRDGFFQTMERLVAAHPTLANWRHQLSLDFLREQVAQLRAVAEEAAGHYPPAKQEAALQRYCELALKAWDILDLSNLPEGDVDIATQKLLLRQLYMPLRVESEPSRRDSASDEAIAALEGERLARRRREAGMLDSPQRNGSERQPKAAPVGHRLADRSRLVVLGDPGGGKTTMLRWMATAYLLQQQGDQAHKAFPDVETLPKESWTPVLILCRDLGPADLCRCFVDFLTQHLSKSELLPAEADVMRAVILDRLARGEILLLVDGLDEITDSRVRAMFCQELERTAVRYPQAPIVVTSRIVGYRDMPYRMGADFEHNLIADVTREDKDDFARRWVEVTDQHHPTEEREQRAKELIDSLHSNDRVERLTGNPMLLTTLALVRRKVGKLPNRRTKLYSEAVSVLLNWNPRHYDIIEEDEAIPQLEYVAFAMCQRGEQRLNHDDILDLLEAFRREYRNVRAVGRRTPEEFLALLEARSSILIKAGNIWQDHGGGEKPAWEFRHLTFQEYLAARALLDGRYPNRSRQKSLAEQVASLEFIVGDDKEQSDVEGTSDEADIAESWRETLRLLVADCRDDDVDDVLLAILRPQPCQDSPATRRACAILATLCLADEPNVSEEAALEVMNALAAVVGDDDEKGPARSNLNQAAVAVSASIWSAALQAALVREFRRRPAEVRMTVGSLIARTGFASWDRMNVAPDKKIDELDHRLHSSVAEEVIGAVLTVSHAAFRRQAVYSKSLVASLLDGLGSDDTVLVLACAWALYWLAPERHGFNPTRGVRRWQPNEADVTRILHAFQSAHRDERDTIRFLALILGTCGGAAAIDSLIEKIDDPSERVRQAVVDALSNLGDKAAVGPLIERIDDPRKLVRRAVVEALGNLGDKAAVGPLIEKIDDPSERVRWAVAYALGNLGDKSAVEPLIARIDDPSEDVRQAVVNALGNLGDKSAVGPLIEKIKSAKGTIRIAAAALLHALGEPFATNELQRLASSQDVETRLDVVAYFALTRDETDRRLLSRDLDGIDPWLDPQDRITEEWMRDSAESLGRSPEDVRERYEAMAPVLNLRLSE